MSHYEQRDYTTSAKNRVHFYRRGGILTTPPPPTDKRDVTWEGLAKEGMGGLDGNRHWLRGKTSFTIERFEIQGLQRTKS